jgi:hypothetical protein
MGPILVKYDQRWSNVPIIGQMGTVLAKYDQRWSNTANISQMQPGLVKYDPKPKKPFSEKRTERTLDI